MEIVSFLIGAVVGAAIASFFVWQLTRANAQTVHAKLSGHVEIHTARIEELTQERGHATQRAEEKEKEIVKLTERLAGYQNVDEWAKGVFTVATTNGLHPVNQSLNELKVNITSLNEAKDQLRTETANLASCFKITSVRGRWGEVALRRVAELAGLQEGVDYELQSSEDDGRPDMVVKLPKDRQLVIDSKVPGSHYAKAMEAKDDQVRIRELKEHAKRVRDRIKELSQKEYQKQFVSLECVVLFIPSEALFHAALESDPTLIEYAFQKNVMIATPATIIGVMRVIEYAWQHSQLEESAEQIHNDAVELYNRVRVFVGHLAKVGSGLENAVKGWNDAVGSYSSRLRKQGERLAEVANPTQKISDVGLVSDTPDKFPDVEEAAASTATNSATE